MQILLQQVFLRKRIVGDFLFLVVRLDEILDDGARLPESNYIGR